MLWWTLRKLKSADLKARVEAIGALAGEKSSQALEAVLAAMKDEKWEVRTAAAHALGALGGVEAAEALLAALDDFIHPVCVAAATSLSRLAYPWTVPAMISCLRTKSPKVVEALADAIVASGWTAVRHVLLSFRAPGGRSVRLLRLLNRFDDPLAIQAILEAMADSDPKIAKTATRLAQARGLVPKPSPAKHPPILELLDRGMRDRARRTLGEMGTAGVDALFNALDSPNPNVISAVLRELTDREDLAIHERLLRHPLHRARMAAATNWIRDRRWPVLLAGALADSSGGVRRAAERRLRDHLTDAEPSLVAALRGGAPAERSAAARALYLVARDRLEDSGSGAERLRELRASMMRERQERLAAERLASARAALLYSLEQVRSRRIDWLVERVLSSDSALPPELDREDAQRLVLDRIARRSPERIDEAARRLALLGSRPALEWVAEALRGSLSRRTAAMEFLEVMKWRPATVVDRVNLALASGKEPPDDGARGVDRPENDEPIIQVRYPQDPERPPMNFEYGDFRRSSMAGFRLREYLFERCDFTATDLSGAHIGECVFFKCLLARLNLRGARLESVRFVECVAPAADLSHSDSRGAEWVDGVWSHAKFSEADLREAAFRGVGLEQASFEGARLDGTIFADCGVRSTEEGP